MAKEPLAVRSPAYVPAERSIPEFTWTAVILGCILAVVMGAANAYLGLYAGMTVSASIPAAVISMGIMRGVLRSGNILQNNLVQTIASSGEAVAAGIIFTVPALVLVGAWQDFAFWPTTLIALCGGVFGVIFMVPLRRALIVEDKTLAFPEGVACAEVLATGEAGGAGLRTIVQGMVTGGALKLLSAGMGVLKGSLEWGIGVGGRVVGVGADVSAALVAVGYIVHLEVAMLVFLGGALGWMVAMPLLPFPEGMEGAALLDVAWTLWSTKVRYIGVGTMLVGGVWSLFSVRQGIVKGFAGLKQNYQSGSGVRAARTDRDMRLSAMGVLFVLNCLLLLGLYKYLLVHLGMAAFTTVVMVVASFLFVAVSSYIVGLVGSSNNPVSGMTICALLGTAALFLVLGMTGDSAIMATLGVAGVVCCAACIAGDCSQDLKTGALVGGTPEKQQWGELLGVACGAVVLAPTLSMLHHAYGIGTGLKAPQATLFASIAKAMFGDGVLPYDMVYWGVALGVVLIATNEWLKKQASRFRTHVMPVAVGIYLPITLSIPILIGGLVRARVEAGRARRREKVSEGSDPGVLLGSGMIAGEALMGIGLAMVISLGWKNAITITGITDQLMTALSLGALAVTVAMLRNSGKSARG